MQQSSQLRGRPKKKPRTRKAQDWGPSSSCILHSDANAKSSDAKACSADANAEPSGAGVPPADAEPSGAGAPPVDADINLSDVGTPQEDADGDHGDVSELAWDSDIGLKPSVLDGNASDDSVEEFLPEEAGERAQSVMDKMMIKLEKCDTQDTDWLPPKERKKMVPKKIGMISSRAQVVKELTMGLRKAKGALSWTPHRCKVGMSATGPQECSYNAKSDTTH